MFKIKMVGIFSNILFEVQVQPNNLFGIKNESNGYNIPNVNKRDTLEHVFTAEGIKPKF